jgi:hypothetical protein
MKPITEANHYITNISLQYVNCFITIDEANYSIGDIFTLNSPYLSNKVRNSGPLWHLYQGWVENDVSLNCNCLNNLNISTSKKDNELVTAISIFRQAELSNDVLNTFDQLKGQVLLGSKIEEIMNGLRMACKKMLLELLAEEISIKIGLQNKE